MTKNPNRKPSPPENPPLPEVFVSNTALTRWVSREVSRGTLRKVGPKVYTSNLTDSPESLVRRNLWPLVAALYPGALIADRTALENGPAQDGSVFLVCPKKGSVVLPGVTIRPREGLPPLSSDREFIGGLRLSSPARGALENIKESRSRAGAVSRTLSPVELESYLEDLLQSRGEQYLNQLRDEARSVASVLNLVPEFEKLEKLIGTLLGTRTTTLRSGPALARIAGTPYDARRIKLFEQLRSDLERLPPISRYTTPESSSRRATLPFFESYFSNFIEGTEFEVEEAAEIVFSGAIPSQRPSDAHDVLGTYKITSDEVFMSQAPRSSEQLLEKLKVVHATIMGGRPEKLPGRFKNVFNRAGSTEFVAPDLVQGTLIRGFELLDSLRHPFSRAAFMMFLISEVHPFLDGNGRTARIFMNMELVTAAESRIIIPTVYRNDYLRALKAVTHNQRTEALHRVLDFSQRYTAAVDWSDLGKAKMILTRTNAFVDPTLAEQQGVYLIIPDASVLG